VELRYSAELGYPCEFSLSIWKPATALKCFSRTFRQSHASWRWLFLKTHEQPWRLMRILLDESVPAGLGALLVGHTFMTVPKRGWAGLKNGHLLTAAAPEFDVLLTADKNIECQQNLASLPVAILVVLAASNRMVDLAPKVPAILRALNHLEPNRLQRVDG